MKVCFVSSHYPPLSRTLRRGMFARYLSEGGCDVEVVAHGNVSRALGTFTDDVDMAGAADAIPVHRPKCVPWYLTGEVLFRLGLVPCSYVNWLRAATRAAARIAAGPGDIAFGLYPPVTNLLVARAVSRRTGARLVVDFRDEYLGLSTGLRRGWARRLEAAVVREAVLVSVATPQVGANLRSRYGIGAAALHLTENGYWEEPQGDLTYPRRERLRVVYAGAISAAQGVETLCRAVRFLEGSQPELAARLEVLIFGPDNLYLRQGVQPLLGGRVTYGGLLTAGQVSEQLLGADVCYLSLASERYSYAVPGKLYEYIAHARPVLASLPSGPARDLVEGESIGMVAPCGDERQLAARLVDMLDLERRLACHRNLLAVRGRYAARPHFLSLARRLLQLP